MLWQGRRACYIPTLANKFAASSAFRVAAAQPSLQLGFAGYPLRTLLSSSLLPALKQKKHPFLRMSVFNFMVGPERIELSRHCCHQILSLARLPIPPQPHKNYTTLIYHIFSSVKTFFAFFINIFALHLFVAVLYSSPVDKKLRLQWKI